MFGKFLDFAKANNLEILKDDVRFIRDTLKNVPYNLHRSVLRRYCDEWVRMAGECESALCAQNLGRRHANKFLLQIRDENRWTE